MCYKLCLHFVGFHDEAYLRAVNLFGKPDFIHRYWDRRAMSDVAPGDIVVLAGLRDHLRFVNQDPVAWSFNDSEEF